MATHEEIFRARIEIKLPAIRDIEGQLKGLEATAKSMAEKLNIQPQITGARHHVILSHPPPRDGKLDRTFVGRHVGSTALRAFIERTRPALVLCGHIHEARAIEALGPTTVVNFGAAAAGFYAVAEVGEEVNVELRKA